MTSFEKKYIEARKSAIAADFAHLNPMQRQAVLTTEGPLLLLAGAGSGKTTVLIQRIANLLRYGRGSDSDWVPPFATGEDLTLLEAVGRGEKTLSAEQRALARELAAVEPAEPWRILAITFTNKAADELKKRLESLLGADAQDVWAQTFHSACARILRRDADKLGFPLNFTIYDTADSLTAMKRVLEELNLSDRDFPPKAVLAAVSRAKDELLSPREYLALAQAANELRRVKIGEAYEAYARRLMKAGAMDFDDLQYFTVRLLQEYEDVREYYQRKFKYVLIDEYQDTNHLQYLLVSLLADRTKNICVVGDDDQSIYRFRGASIENILSFEEQYKDAKVIRLEQNYRSTGHILDAANAVILNNKGRKGKTLWTQSEAGEKLSLYIAQNENDEARFVAEQITKAAANGAAWRDHAVLYRMNAQSRQVEDALKRANIPYRIIGGTRFFDRAEVRDMLAYLHVLVNPSDDVRLMRIVNVPVRGIGQTSLERARQLASERGTSLYEIMRNAGEHPELSRAALSMRKFINMMEELRSCIGEVSLSDLYDLLLEKTGYLLALEEKNTDEDTARAENVKELKSSILSYTQETGDDGIYGFLDEVSLYTDIDNYDKDADSVVLMTMHAAKGLEFPTVFLVGAEEGIFPGLKAIGETEEMEEERRLCYVAITRAKRKLYLCSAAQRMLFGRSGANLPSRFLEEIPPEHLERSAAPRPDSFGGTRLETNPPAFRRTARAAPASPYSLGAGKPASIPAVSYQEGDEVEHKVFGRGAIVKMTPMGGDALVEIAFEEQGMKRLMLRAAIQYMTKR
jgi:DNA helicase-2/ATP-dependent DNA helicase PcrA